MMHLYSLNFSSIMLQKELLRRVDAMRLALHDLSTDMEQFIGSLLAKGATIRSCEPFSCITSSIPGYGTSTRIAGVSSDCPLLGASNYAFTEGVLPARSVLLLIGTMYYLPGEITAKTAAKLTYVRTIPTVSGSYVRLSHFTSVEFGDNVPLLGAGGPDVTAKTVDQSIEGAFVNVPSTSRPYFYFSGVRLLISGVSWEAGIGPSAVSASPLMDVEGRQSALAPVNCPLDITSRTILDTMGRLEACSNVKVVPLPTFFDAGDAIIQEDRPSIRGAGISERLSQLLESVGWDQDILAVIERSTPNGYLDLPLLAGDMRVQDLTTMLPNWDRPDVHALCWSIVTLPGTARPQLVITDVVLPIFTDVGGNLFTSPLLKTTGLAGCFVMIGDNTLGDVSAPMSDFCIVRVRIAAPIPVLIGGTVTYLDK